eukprot:747259-Hanusia_phi.AAC.5
MDEPQHSKSSERIQGFHNSPMNTNDEMKHDAGEALHKQSSLYMLSLMHGLSIARTRNLCLKTIAGTESIIEDEVSNHDGDRTLPDGSA